MKTKLKKMDKKTEELFKASSVAVLLENMNDNIKILAEGQLSLREEMHRNTDDLRGEISDLRGEMHGAINNLRGEMKEGFDLLMEYIMRIDKEVVSIRKEFEDVKEKKVDWSIYSALEKRMNVAEIQIEKMKVLLKLKNSN
jgi:predicted  nucleic acid-binding Zn-ribbon protein